MRNSCRIIVTIVHFCPEDLKSRHICDIAKKIDLIWPEFDLICMSVSMLSAEWQVNIDSSDFSICCLSIFNIGQFYSKQIAKYFE